MNRDLPDWAYFLTEPSRYKCAWGGRGSGKSWAFARALLLEGVNSTQRILCCREVQKSLKDSVHQLLTDQISEMELDNFYQVTESEIRGRNGTLFLFAGLKSSSVTSIKSFEGCTRCWVEEAQTLSKRSWEILVPTIRAENSEIWVSFNPELETDETYQRFVVNPPTNCVSRKVNWNLNPWFPEVLREEKDQLKDRDPEAYRMVWEGICRRTVDGAVYAHEMTMAELDQRITQVPYDSFKPVYVAMDLGWADQTSIWFWQLIGQEIRIIRYIEDNQKTISHYLSLMQTYGYTYDTIYLPHDAKAKNLGSGQSIEEIVRASNIAKVQILNILPIADGINATRSIFNRMWFDANKCSDGLQCLRHYRYEVDEQKGFGRVPIHDMYSHGADALRYLATAIRDPKPKSKKVYIAQSNWMS
jgi:phage terminase large subunit